MRGSRGLRWNFEEALEVCGQARSHGCGIETNSGSVEEDMREWQIGKERRSERYQVMI